MDHGQHFTFCCLGHSDLNCHFKNLNTSNTSLTLGEPYKPKYTLSAMSSKHDSMCHRMHRTKHLNSELRIHLKLNSEFLESSKLLPWPFLNYFRHLEFSQLTMNSGKLNKFYILEVVLMPLF